MASTGNFFFLLGRKITLIYTLVIIILEFEANSWTLFYPPQSVRSPVQYSIFPKKKGLSLLYENQFERDKQFLK